LQQILNNTAYYTYLPQMHNNHSFSCATYDYIPYRYFWCASINYQLI